MPYSAQIYVPEYNGVIYDTKNRKGIYRQGN